MEPITVPPDAIIQANVAAALAEDLGSGDVTAALLEDVPASGYLLCKEDAVIAGRPWFDATHRALDPQVRIDWQVEEGQQIAAGTVLALLHGRTRSLVSAERTSLNFMQTLCATATVTAQYVAAVAGTGTRILDTRKTLPGLRLAQKYAVRCGGGLNHRIGLFDTVMLKETTSAPPARSMPPSPPRAPRSPACRWWWKWKRWTNCATHWLLAATASSSMISMPTCAARRCASPPDAFPWKCRAAWTWPPCAASPPTAWTTSPSAP